MADFDGDGRVDVAAIVPGEQTLAWWKRLVGVSGPWNRTDVGAADSPGALAAADFDGDGDVDLLAGDTKGQDVTFWANTGAGATWASSKIGSLSMLTSIAAVDVDNDVDPDAAVGGVSDFGWLEQSGEPGPLAYHDLLAGAGPWTAVTAGDLDGDGDAELLGVAASSVQVAENVALHRRAHFTELATTPGVATSFANPRSQRKADVDGDGDRDVVSAQLSGSPKLYLNDGAGGWTEETLATTGGDVSLGDIDSDGDLDVFTHNPIILPGFTWLEQTASGWLEHTIESFPLGTGTSPHTGGVDAADLDLDGDLDVIGSFTLTDVATGAWVDGGYVWYENHLDEATGAPADPLWRQHELPWQAFAPHPVLTLEVEADADADVLAFDATLLIAFRNVGASLEARPLASARPVVFAGAETPILTFDLDHQGRPDDRGAALRQVTVRFTDDTGQVLSQADVDALLGALRLRRRFGAPTFVAEVVGTWRSVNLMAGEAVLEIPAGIPDAVVTCCEAPATFILTLETALGVADMVPSPLRVSIPEHGLTVAEDVDDLSVAIEAMGSQEAVFSLVDDSLFFDRFESGDTSAWTP